MDEGKIKDLLERIGIALSTGDLPGITSCWAVPALVLSDQGVTAVSESREVEQFFAQATEWYHAQGLTATRPELERVDWLSEKLASIDVRWPSFNSSGQEKFSERSHYIVQLGQDGQARIRVALTRTM